MYAIISKGKAVFHMTSIKKTVESFLYPFIDKYTEAVYHGGEDTVMEGVRVLDDETGFTHGALIHAAAILYVKRMSEEDSRAEEVLTRLLEFIDIPVKRDRLFTWGKLAALRALTKLSRAGLLDKITPDRLTALNRLTDYSDFLDKETLELRGYPTNYYHVALACALYRERLGFDGESFSERIEEKLYSFVFIEGAYPDEEPKLGRYDRYSFLLAAELADLYRDVEMPLPDGVKRNLLKSVDFALFMSNPIGDGWNYGRSLSMHGDLAPAELIASALAHGLVKEDEKDKALSYIFSVLEKTLFFWYDVHRQSFNIWWDGKTTNNYRQTHRILEVNMDMASHLYALCDNLLAAGLAESPVSRVIPMPREWEYKKLEFDGAIAAYILRHEDTLSMLPFIGTKKLMKNTSYNPFPAICGVIEASPESSLPFLIPEYTDTDGEKYRPAHHVYKTEEKRTEDGLLITAYGRLMRASDGDATDIEYRHDFLFSGSSIISEIEIFSDMTCAEMITATESDDTVMLVGGFDSSERLEILDTNDFKTPHGAYTRAYRHTSTTPKRLGYKITFHG